MKALLKLKHISYKLQLIEFPTTNGPAYEQYGSGVVSITVKPVHEPNDESHRATFMASLSENMNRMEGKVRNCRT